MKKVSRWRVSAEDGVKGLKEGERFSRDTTSGPAAAILKWGG